jgi:hypothetical protein
MYKKKSLQETQWVETFSEEAFVFWSFKEGIQLTWSRFGSWFTLPPGFTPIQKPGVGKPNS